MRILRRKAGLVVVLLCACGGGASQPSPVLAGVDPSSGIAGVAVPVRITGDNFLVSARDDRHRAWLDDLELQDVIRVDVHTLTATVPAGLSPGAKTLRVENAIGREGELADAFTVLATGPRLAASLAVDRASAAVGQPIHVTLTLTNGGTGDADLSAVSPTQSGVAGTCGPVSPALPLRLGYGRSRVFTWQCAGSAAGSLELGANASGVDAVSGAGLSADALPSKVTIQSPAALAASIGLDGNPGAVTVGQAFTLRLSATNRGGGAADVASLTVTPLETGCGAPSPAPPRTVEGGRSAVFTLTCAATAAGNLAPAVSVRGRDANSGALLTAAATLAPLLTVRPPTSLATAIAASPTIVSIGQRIDVTFYVINGAARAATVTGMGSWSTGTAAATCTAVTVSPGTTVDAGATRSFGWSCTPRGAGDLLLSGTLTYTSGEITSSASPAVPLEVIVTP